MTSYCTTIRPFRIADGECTPESCSAADANGWEAFRDGGRRYFYRTKREAQAAGDVLRIGGAPIGGYPFWPRATIYLP